MKSPLVTTSACVLIAIWSSIAMGQAFDETIDIGPTGQDVESGAIAVTGPAANTNGTDLAPQMIMLGVHSVMISIDDTNQSGADVGGIDWRDRGNGPAQPLVDVAEDFVKNNLGIIRLTFDGLPAGEYVATGYHVDGGFTQAEDIQVFADVDGMGFLNITDIAGDANSNVAVGSLTTADVEASASAFTFIADGINPVAIIFDATNANDDEVPLNGLRLQFTPVPEPASIAIWSLIGLGLAGFGYRRYRRTKS